MWRWKRSSSAGGSGADAERAKRIRSTTGAGGADASTRAPSTAGTAFSQVGRQAATRSQ